MRIIFIIVLSILFSAFNIMAQNTQKDSIEFTIDMWQYKDGFFQVDSVPFDTNLTCLDDAYYSLWPQLTINLGNEGFPVYALNPELRAKQYNYLERGLLPYNSTILKTKFYNVSKPLTVVNYVNSGAKLSKYQRINVYHTQNFSEKLNVGLRFINNSALGYYNNQEAHDINFNYWTALKFDKYKSDISASFNRYKNQENGGLISKEEFNRTDVAREDFYQVWLENAKSITKFHEVFINQEYLFSNSDSIKNGLRHKGLFKVSSRVFSDEGSDTTYYQSFGLDSVMSEDSLFFSELSNGFYFFDERKLRTGKLKVSAGLSHSFYRFFHQSKNIENNLSLELYSSLIRQNDKLYFGRSRVVLLGYNKGDYEFDFGLESINNHSFLNYKISLFHEVKRPDWFYYNLSLIPSEQDVKYQINTIVNTLIGLSSLKFSSLIKAALVANPIYFNELAQAKQDEGAFPYFSITLNKDFHLGGFRWTNSLNYQKIANTNNIPFPDLYYRTSVYYENDLLDKVLHFQLGVESWVMNGYNAPGFMPVYGIYYTQNQVVKNPYPMVNVFAKFKLKTARILIKYEHVHEGMLPKEYYSATLYPLAPRRLTWGLVWFFYD